MGFLGRVMFGIAVLVSASVAFGCAPAQTAPPLARLQPAAEQTRTADSLSPSLDGLAFVRDGKLYRVSGTTAIEIVRDGRRKLGVVSADRSNALLLTEEHGDGADVVFVHGTGTRSAKTLLNVADANALLGVHYDFLDGRLYRAVEGDPSARLMTSPLDRPSDVTTLALEDAFSGEFDIDALGGTVVYTSAAQNPARLLASRGSHTRVLTSRLVAVFAPAVSPDGLSVCFTGDAIAVWVLDLSGKSLRRLAPTAGLVPTHPVFSGDGLWIAFRSGSDGELHAIRADGTGARTLPFVADDAALAW